jgi:hypothetical protein
MDLPSYHALDYWAPLFDAICDHDVVTNMHIGQGFFAIKGPPEAGIDNLMILATQVSAFSAQDSSGVAHSSAGPASRSRFSGVASAGSASSRPLRPPLSQPDVDRPRLRQVAE